MNGIVHSPHDVEENMLSLAHNVAQKHTSFFYTIDIVKQEKEFKVIEIGDGQVSDMVGWEQKDFIKIFDSLKDKNKIKIR